MWDHFVAKFDPTGTSKIYYKLLDGTATSNAVFTASPSTNRDGGIAVDISGNAYVVGTTSNDKFPTTAGAFQTRIGNVPPPPPASPPPSADAVIVKLDSGGNKVYSTFYGGTGTEHGHGIAVASGGDVWVVGNTNSTNLPTMSPFQAANAGGIDAFALHLSASGGSALLASYDGTSGSDDATGVALIGSGVVLSETSAAQAVARQITAAGGAGYRTVLGTGDAEVIAADGIGGVWVGGTTSSSVFPQIAPAQTGYGGGGSDGFLAELNTTGTAMVSTFLGGTGVDGIHGLAVLFAGDLVAGGTTDSPNFPVTHTPAATDAFLVRLNLRPNVPVITSISADTGLSATDFVTSDTTLTISGTSVASATVNLYSDSTLLGTAVASSGGAWSVVVSAPFVDGRYPLTATATVASLTSDSSARRYLVVDTVPPIVTLALPPNSSDPLPIVEVYADDSVGSGIPDGSVVSVDVDLNRDGFFAGSGVCDRDHDRRVCPCHIHDATPGRERVPSACPGE